MTWLLRLYPRVWRARYEEEVRHMLAEEPRTVRLMVDLLALRSVPDGAHVLQ